MAQPDETVQAHDVAARLSRQLIGMQGSGDLSDMQGVSFVPSGGPLDEGEGGQDAGP